MEQNLGGDDARIDCCVVSFPKQNQRWFCKQTEFPQSTEPLHMVLYTTPFFFVTIYFFSYINHLSYSKYQFKYTKL
jgi:predicted amidophosphoribosyltransferase